MFNDTLPKEKRLNKKDKWKVKDILLIILFFLLLGLIGHYELITTIL